MSCMFDMQYIFQDVAHRFNHATSSIDGLVFRKHELVFHVLSKGVYQLNAARTELFNGLHVDVPFIARQFSKQAACQNFDRGAISAIHIARGQIETQKLSSR